jgi:cellulose synthase/poly-beta-1,6-N-acetylglucosamine synthase-like glycosyltransferase
MPHISLIIPIYNAGSYIDACMASLVAQTLDDIEVLLVDDHGRDDSMERARRFVEAHPSGKTFRFLATPHNMGPGPARNVGIEAAQGEYVAHSLQNYLSRHPEMDERCTKGGTCRFLTTESTAKFKESASLSLCQEDMVVKSITLE